MKNKNIIDFAKRWAIFFILFLILIFVLSKVGTCVIHEPGHYLAGKIYGCTDLKISCPAIFGDEISNYVEGWESCPDLIVIGEQGERICNLKTHIANLSGLFLSLIIVVPLFLITNNFYLKRRIKKYYLDGKFFILILLTIVIWLLKSSAVDLFKIGECLVNSEFANKLLNLLWVIPDIFIYVVLIIFIIDVYTMLLKEKIIVFNRQKTNHKQGAR